MNSQRMAALALAVGVLVVSGCTGNASEFGAPRPSPDGADKTTGAKSGSEDAPDFTALKLDGGSFRLSETNGKIRLIDFWATWCAPCREEIPMLNELHADYAEKGLLILAITDEDTGTVRDFVEEHGVEYLNVIASEDVSADYKVLGLPAAYLIDAEGRLVKSFLGPKPRRVLVEQIEALLGETPAI